MLEYFEGRRHQSYPDPAAGGHPWTIGVGATGPDIVPGLYWTDEQIDARLAEDLLQFEFAVDKMLAGKRVPTQGEFDALVLFAFNLGEGNLRTSSLLRMYLAGDTAGAAGQFPRWNNAAGRPMLGLARRRSAERDLFLGRTAETAIAAAKLIQHV